MVPVRPRRSSRGQSPSLPRLSASARGSVVRRPTSVGSSSLPVSPPPPALPSGSPRTRMFAMFSGKVKIEICEAKELRATDKQRKFWKEKEEPTLDPYVQLDVDELHLARTTTKLKTSYPVWNECFIHEVQQALFLGLTIFHDAVLPPDYFIANCKIPFTDLVKSICNGFNDLWVSSRSSRFSAGLHARVRACARVYRTSRAARAACCMLHAARDTRRHGTRGSRSSRSSRLCYWQLVVISMLPELLLVSFFICIYLIDIGI